MQSDDFDSYFNSKNSMESIKYFYLTWNARSGELIFQEFIGNIQPYLFDFINSIVGICFLIAFFTLIFGRLPKYRIDCILIVIMLLALVYANAFGSNFIWTAGATNYMWGIFFVILFLLPFRFSYERLLLLNSSFIKSLNPNASNLVNPYNSNTSNLTNWGGATKLNNPIFLMPYLILSFIGRYGK